MTKKRWKVVRENAILESMKTTFLPISKFLKMVDLLPMKFFSFSEIKWK